MKKCLKCNCEFEPRERLNGSHSLYCAVCRTIMKQKKNQNYLQKKHQEKRNIGTTDFDSHLVRQKDKTPDFNAEHRAIRFEMRELGICRHGNSKADKKQKL